MAKKKTSTAAPTDEVMMDIIEILVPLKDLEADYISTINDAIDSANAKLMKSLARLAKKYGEEAVSHLVPRDLFPEPETPTFLNMAHAFALANR